MKIPDSLRAAIKSFCATTKAPSYNQREEDSAKAVRMFIKAKPKYRKLVADAQAAFDKATKFRKVIKDELGLHLSCKGEISVTDVATFVAAGGVMPEYKVVSFDLIMMRLASATTPERGAEILREIGIIWN